MPMLYTSTRAVDPARSASDSRRDAVVLALLSWLLGSLLLAGSIFSAINTWLIGVAGFYLLHVFGHLAIIGLAIGSPQSRRQILQERAILIAVVLYGALVFVSTASQTIGIVSARLGQALLIPATIVSLAVCLPAVLSDEGYRTLFKILIVMLTLSAVASLVVLATRTDHVLGRELTHWGEYRGGRFAASGLYTNPNALGSFLEFAPAIIVLLICVERRHLFAYAAALAIIVVHLALTFSRSAMAVVILSLLPLLPRGVHRHTRLAYAFAAALAVALVLSWETDFRRYLDPGLAMRSRMTIWREAAVRIEERPMLGFGLLNVTLPVNLNVTPAGQTAHSVYVAQVLYFGWVGFTAFIAVAAAFGARLYAALVGAHGRPETAVLIAVLIGAACQGLLEYIITFPLFFTNSLFWILLGMVAARKR